MEEYNPRVGIERSFWLHYKMGPIHCVKPFRKKGEVYLSTPRGRNSLKSSRLGKTSLESNAA